MSESDQKEDLRFYTKGEDGKLVPDYDQTIQSFDEGDIISGVIVKIDNDEVLVDVGYKSEGVIPQKELSIRRNKKPRDIVNMGQQIEALVLQKEDVDGRLILSKRRADFEKAWESVENCYQQKDTIEGHVIEVVKGGLIVDIGMRGFLPASLVELHRVKDLNDFVGQTLACRVIEVDRRRNNVVLSRRAVLEKERSHERLKILDKLEVGQILSGKISSIVDFGAFVDLGGIDGLIHISELSWTHVSNPGEVVEIGQDVKVQVLEIDYEKERISLGLKQTQSDPWQEIPKIFNEGQLIEGKITKIVPFGAFIELVEGIEGLIHISELSVEEVNSVEQIVCIGQKVKAVITEIETERRRISLSVKKLHEEDESKPEDVEVEQKEVKEKTEDLLDEKDAQEAVLKEKEDLAEKAKEEEIEAAAKFEGKTKEEKVEVTEKPEEKAEEKVEAQKESVKDSQKKKEEDIEEKKAQLEEPKEESKEKEDDKKVSDKENLLESTLERDTEDETVPEPGTLEEVLQDMKKKRSKNS